MAGMTVRIDGTMVLLTNPETGSTIAVMPWQAALELGKLIFRAGKAAEQTANREKIIMDQAVLVRAGVPIGLTDDPDMKAAAAHKAAWDRELRRSKLGMSIPSREIVGTPTIKQTPPKEKK